MALNSLKKFKNLFGGLDFNSIKTGLNYGRKFINIAKDINELGQKHNIDAVNKITDRLINNKNFKQFEKAVGVSEGIIGAIETNKKSGLFNKNPSDINKIGENHAFKRHNENKFKRKNTIATPLDENLEAERIVNNIK